jgi:eukaryotic-like serine/threonine-protein kinase
LGRVESSHRVARFEGFELDLRSGELRRQGDKPVSLAEQPFVILSMLLERAGNLVTREEIREALWPHGTVVEYEHSISAAINRLRQVLGDSAEEPHYIETLARRGYRWRSRVEWAEGSLLAAEPATAAAGPNKTSDRSLIGKKISHYRVLEVLGGGGMGVVYKAEDLKLGRRVALKFLPEELGNDAVVLERFEREARAASALDHPNICAIHEFSEHEGQPFLAMKYLEGQTLREHIETANHRGTPLGTVEFLDLAIQIAQGLNAAHQKGIVHRDIKPANIFVTTQGEAKILDFGLAKLAPAETTGAAHTVDERQADDIAEASREETRAESSEPFLSQTGVTMGTAGYMSPEQVRGEKLDARTDLFSFGLVLYEMSTGQRAFTGETVTILHHAIVNRIPTPARQLNPNLTVAQEKVINKALEKDREARYQTAGEMLSDLKRLRAPVHSAAPELPSRSVFPTRAAVGRKRWLLPTLSVVVILAAGSLFTGLYFRRAQASRLTEQDTVVLGDFANSTGDAIFDDTLKPALKRSLRQSPFMNVLSDQNVAFTLDRMTRPRNTPLTPEVAREICRRQKSKVYIAPAIALLGGEYVIGLRAVNCLSGEVVAQQQATVESKDQVLHALGNAATNLREQLGESLATVGKFGVALDQTTPSLEALREYNLAMSAGDSDSASELPHFLRAIQLDPNFAMAYLGTAETYSNMNQGERATEYFTKAFQLRDHADAREKLEIESNYYAYVTGELEKAAQTYQITIESYPKSPAPYGNLSYVYSQHGQYAKALDLARQVLKVWPSFGGEAYQGIAENLLPLQRFEEAHQILQTAVDHKLDTDGVHKDLYALGFVENNSHAMAEQLGWLESKPEYANLGLSLESDAEAYAGRLGKARDLTSRAAESAVRTDSKEAAALAWDNAALREALFRNMAQARQFAAKALGIAPASQHVQIYSALAFALAGDKARAESLKQDLGRRFPLDSQVQTVWLPTIEAQLALTKGNSAAAIERLQTVAPVELGAIPFSTSISCLFPVYVRGQAYLASGEGIAAAGEFQKILDHNGMVWNCPTGALARVGLARANVLQTRSNQGVAADASRTRARSTYQDFLMLWKDADPDIPVLRQAKAEFATLD